MMPDFISGSRQIYGAACVNIGMDWLLQLRTGGHCDWSFAKPTSRKPTRVGGRSF